MKIELEVYPFLCSTRVFNINDIEADSEDFGTVEDTEPFDLEDAHAFDSRRFCCRNAKFIINMDREHIHKIMLKYQITFEEYREIAEQLEEILSFGSCGYCV